MTDTRTLGRARAELTALPDLIDELTHCLTERPADTGTGATGKPGSKAPLRLDVLHLVDNRRKPDWHGADPRAQDLTDRHGVVAMLELWTRTLADELPEFPDLAETPTVRTEASVLVEHWDWITDQDWADELADDILRVARQVRTALGQRREYHPRCRELHCGWRLTPMDGGTWYRCTGCGRDYTLDADLKALGQLQTATAHEAALILGVRPDRIRQWIQRGHVTHTARDPLGRKLYDLGELRRVVDRLKPAV